MDNIFFDTNTIFYNLVTGVSSELNAFFYSDSRIKNYHYFTEEAIYKISVEIDKEIQPKRVTVREIFFDFISFIAYSNGGIYSITEEDNTFFCSFLTYNNENNGIYFQITFA